MQAVLVLIGSFLVKAYALKSADIIGDLIQSIDGPKSVIAALCTSSCV